MHELLAINVMLFVSWFQHDENKVKQKAFLTAKDIYDVNTRI